MNVFYDDRRFFNSFISKYYEASSPLHALLHAEHFYSEKRQKVLATKLRFFPLWETSSPWDTLPLSRLDEIKIKSFHRQLIIIVSGPSVRV